MISRYEVEQYWESLLVQRVWASPHGIFAEKLRKDPISALREDTGLSVLANLSLECLWPAFDEIMISLPEPSFCGELRFPLLKLPSHLSLQNLYLERKNFERRLFRRLMDFPERREELLKSPRAVIFELLGERVPDSYLLKIEESDPSRLRFIIPSYPLIAHDCELDELEQGSGWQFSTSRLWVFQVVGGELNSSAVRAKVSSR